MTRRWKSRSGAERTARDSTADCLAMRRLASQYFPTHVPNAHKTTETWYVALTVVRLVIARQHPITRIGLIVSKRQTAAANQPPCDPLCFLEVSKHEIAVTDVIAVAEGKLPQ